MKQNHILLQDAKRLDNAATINHTNYKRDFYRSYAKLLRAIYDVEIRQVSHRKLLDDVKKELEEVYQIYNLCHGCGRILVHPDDWGDYDDACEWGCEGCGEDEFKYSE